MDATFCLLPFALRCVLLLFVTLNQHGRPTKWTADVLAVVVAFGVPVYFSPLSTVFNSSFAAQFNCELPLRSTILSNSCIYASLLLLLCC